jgi:hypothetical protein
MSGRAIRGFFTGGGMYAGVRGTRPHGGTGSFELDPVRLGLADGGGSPLPQAVRAKMEAGFGTDFSDVRIHVGPQAARVGAAAFTTSNDIYFAPGRYEPHSQQGQRLLGHELAHVVQQRQGRVRAPGSGVSVVQDRFLEAEAERMGVQAALVRDVPRHDNFRQSTESRLRAPLRPNGRVLIQRHPLTIKVPGYKDWSRDTAAIAIDEDINLFRAKIHDENERVTSIEVRKKGMGDHQVLVVGTEDGKFTQMDIASFGAILRYDVEQDHYPQVEDTYTPNEGLTLHDAFRAFYQHTCEKPFHFTDYNCIRFVTDLACRIGKYQKKDEDDLFFM